MKVVLRDHKRHTSHRVESYSLYWSVSSPNRVGGGEPQFQPVAIPILSGGTPSPRKNLGPEIKGKNPGLGHPHPFGHEDGS